MEETKMRELNVYDLIIRGARRHDTLETVDVAVRGGRIAAVGYIQAEAVAGREIAAAGLLLAPGFVDSHTHLDKSQSISDKESPTLLEAIRNYDAFVESIPFEERKENIKARARLTLRDALANGTTTVRTHVNVDGRYPLLAAEAIAELREELNDVIEIKITAMPSFFVPEVVWRTYLAAIVDGLGRGLFDAVGGSPHHYLDQYPHLAAELFELAVRHDVPVDFHTDEHDRPDVTTLLKTIELTKQYGYEGRVSCSHVTALNAVDDDTAAFAVQGVREAGISIITLPSCNLYLMGRNDRQPIRRGVTRIREFSDAGVNIVYASDNIRDPFRPIGNGDMLEEGLLTAQVAQMVTKSDLEKVFRMGTYQAAKAVGLTDYGIDEGCRADLVLIDAADTAEALTKQGTRRYVIKGGRVVAENERSRIVAF